MTSPEPRFYDFQNGKLTVSLTTACNLRCLMCPVIHRHAPRSLARTQALDVARFGAERGFGMVELSGGEPFLLPYIQELIEIACVNRASTVNVTTNATLLKPADIDFLANFPNLQIQVSFDGLGETHDAIRGKRGAFAAADAAVRALVAKGVHLALNTVVQQGNAHQLYDIYSHFSDIPYAWHGITPYEPGSPNIEAIRIAPEQTAALTDALLRIKQAAAAAQKPVALSDELIASFGERIATRDAAGGFAHPGLLCTVPCRAARSSCRPTAVSHPASTWPGPSTCPNARAGWTARASPPSWTATLTKTRSAGPRASTAAQAARPCATTSTPASAAK